HWRVWSNAGRDDSRPSMRSARVSRPYNLWILCGVLLFPAVACSFYYTGFVEKSTFGGAPVPNALAILLFSTLAVMTLFVVFDFMARISWDEQSISKRFPFGKTTVLQFADLTGYKNNGSLGWELTTADGRRIVLQTKYYDAGKELSAFLDERTKLL